MHLTDVAVKRLKPASTAYWDESTPGFGLRVGKHTKTWIVMRGRDRERTVIGRYPDLPLQDARLEAKKLLLIAPEPKAKTVLLADAREEFVEQNYRYRAPRTKKEARRVLLKHFGTLPRALVEINDTHIKVCLDKLAGMPAEQLHAYRSVRCFLRWCTRPPRRYIRHSPMEGYEPPGKDRRGTRILSDRELAAVYKAASSPTRSIVRLLILWGTRNTETASIERQWVSDRVLTIPGAHTKNGRDHGIPILPLVQGVLDGLPDTPKHYFPSRWGESHLQDGAWSKIKREIQAISGTKDWQLRDLRRTFRSNMARLKVPRDLCEVLINHAPPILDEIYDRYDRLEEKREALQRYELFLEGLLKS